MRLWSKQLLPYLPRLQLVSQWRECCCIAKNIAEKGTPNHILVNRIMDYPIGHFWIYGAYVAKEMRSHGYKCNFDKFDQYIDTAKYWDFPNFNNLFKDWHDKRYFRQCLNNLEEKAICGGIPAEEWDVIYSKFGEQFDLWNGNEV